MRSKDPGPEDQDFCDKIKLSEDLIMRCKGLRKTAIVLFACMIVMVIRALTPSYAEAKVGFINLQRLVNESKMGQSARSEFQKMRQEKESIVAAKLREVNELRDLINQAGDQMSPQDKRNKLLALQKANKEYQRLVADVNEDILREDRQLVSIILQKADSVLKKVAQRMNYTIILKDANVIGYLDPSVDITDEVIKELNQK